MRLSLRDRRISRSIFLTVNVDDSKREILDAVRIEILTTRVTVVAGVCVCVFRANRKDKRKKRKRSKRRLARYS